jgi:hypothetical protein
MKQAGFCYECSEFFIHEDVWGEHCASHVSDPDLFCGQIVCRGIIIFARKCMFCLADANLTMAERYHGFTHAPSFFRHLQAHLQSIFEWQIRCPHPKCSATIASEVAFWDHLRAVHGIARYKSGSRRHADIVAATVSGGDRMFEPEMTDTDTSSGVINDGDGDDDEDDEDDDVGGTAEVLQFIQGESTAHTYTANSSTSFSRTNSPVDVDIAQKPGVLLGSSQDRASSSHAGVDRRIDQEVLPAQDTESSNTTSLEFDTTHREQEESTGHDYHLDNTTCVESSDWPPQDLWQVRRPQDEQVYSPTAIECADARSLVDERVPRNSRNGSFMAASIVEPDRPDLAISRTMVGSDGRRERPAMPTKGGDSLILPDATSMPETILPQVPNEVCANAPPSLHGVERYPHLRPILSQAGSACDALGCTEVFRFARDLNYHLMDVHKRSQHTCHVSGCGKMFRDATRLRDHVRTHSGTKTLVCSFDQCGRTFARPDTLLRHRQSVHEKERLFVCDLIKNSIECKMAFDASWKLKRHKEGVHRRT